MRTRKYVREDLLAALEATGDEKFGVLGFYRRKRSFEYKRLIGDATQTINFVCDCSPRYAPDTEVHIHPHMALSITGLEDVALDLVSGNRLLLANAPHIILNQPIEFTAPKEKHVRWFASGAEEILTRVNEIYDFVAAWVIPVFDKLQNSRDLINIYRENDQRVMKQRHWHLFIVAAEILTGSKCEALKILEDKFGAPGLRSIYAVSFDKLRREVESEFSEAANEIKTI